jgi:two-component system cell cycle sensor histidine kinase/response regulator CckA
MSRILVVEDSRTQAHALQAVLEATGFEVEVAFDGEQGLELLHASAFDLVITDIVMPGMSGYELCRKVKEDPARRHVPVILLTSLRDPADMVQGIECGADHFIPKPFRAEDLVGRVRGLFANRALRAESRLKIGVEVVFLGRRFTVTSEKEQILDLLLSTCEELVRTNRDLQAGRADLERRVEERTSELTEANIRVQRLAALVASSEDGIVGTDLDGVITDWNVGAEHLFGYTAEEAVGQSIFMLIPPDARDHGEWTLARLRQGQEVQPYETTRRRKDGGGVVVSVRPSPVRHQGCLLGFSLIYRDLTHAKRLEEQLRQAQKMEAVGQLAGGVAHDFNNLLTIINGYGEVLLGRLRPDDPMGRMLAEIKDAGDRAASLTRQLLVFSRQQVIAPRVLDLNAVVADTARMLRRLIGEDVELATALAPGLGRVKADPGQVEQVLMNLAVNARDAMPTGGKLTIETGNIDIDEGGAALCPGLKPGRYVQLVVTDTGCGMDEATKARVFEPFFTTKERGKGTGLGLAVVYGIVKQSGGFIYVYSEVGSGTAFKVYLPRDEAAAHREKSDVGTSVTPEGTETVLLVEDEEAVRKLTRLTLQTSGYDVLEACNGVEALRVAGRHPGPVHLLVTDVIMPQMSGRELSERLVDRHPGIKVLYLSGYTDDAVVRHGVLQAGVAFLQKPFGMKALARKVREVLDAAPALHLPAEVADDLAQGLRAGELQGTGRVPSCVS